jgi:hypothetical protein
MTEIKPNTIYSTEELQQILKGSIKIRALYSYGLKALPGKGYWSNNVIDSIDRYFDNAVCQRVTNGIGKEINHDHERGFFDNSDTEVQIGQVHSSSLERESMESEWERFNRNN